MDGRQRRIPNTRSSFIYQNSPLPAIEERLFFILVYLKNNPLQEYHAGRFGMNQKQGNTFIHGPTRIPEACLREISLMPAQRQKAFARLPAQISGEEEVPVPLHGGTERDVPRPVRYSLPGKLFAEACMTGKWRIPCTLFLPPAQGYTPPNVTLMQPIKKPGGKELPQKDKEYSRKISSFRIRVEHAIGSVKRMSTVKDECRRRAGDFVHRVFGICAALHNLRIEYNHWHYKN